MLTITKLKMWKDPGYTRQCVEVPPLGSWKLPGTPDYTATELLRPRRGSTLSAMELPLSYLEVHDMSYLYMEVEDGVTPTPNTMKIFGWITHVEEIASSVEAVRIEWTPDYWRTYANSASFGKGVITRCDNATYKRPYQTRPRLKTVSTRYAPFPISGSGGDHQFLVIKTTWVSDEVTGFAYLWGTLDASTATTRTPKTEELYSGEIDEILGVKPSEIVGCWIMPLNMIKSNMFKNTATQSVSYTDPGGTTSTITFNQSETLTDNVKQTSFGLTTVSLDADDMRDVVSVGPYGEIQSSLPWGMSIKGPFDTVTDISCNGVTMYFVASGSDFADALTNGSYLKFDAIQVPITSNDWSEYVYSYQRSYDKRMREIQRNQQAVSGYAGTSQSIVGGAIAGATKGNVAGAVGGAIAGGITSVIGTTVGYFTQGYFNDELQREEDKLISNQSSTVLSLGGGTGWLKTGATISGNDFEWYIAVIDADTVSATEYSQHVANEGYTTEIPVNDPGSFLTNGGPLQIQNLVVTGSIPPEAKTYIKNILSNGVRIVENNPSGVIP